MTRDAACRSDEARFSRPSLSFCHPQALHAAEAADADALDVAFTDHSEPRNFFGLKLRVRALPRASGEALADVMERLVGEAQRGAAKREHVVGAPVDSELDGRAMRRVRLEYTIDGRGVLYRAPDGTQRETPDEPQRIAVSLAVVEVPTGWLVVQLNAEKEREPRLVQMFERVLETLSMEVPR